MKLKCKREAIDEKGQKIMNFTKGRYYEAYISFDPDGWEIVDDKGRKEVFFDINYMFQKTKNNESRYNG